VYGGLKKYGSGYTSEASVYWNIELTDFRESLRTALGSDDTSVFPLNRARRSKYHLLSIPTLPFRLGETAYKNPPTRRRRHLLDDDHPTKHEIKQEQRVDGQERSIFLDLGPSQKVHRGYTFRMHN
jgi:hypothetical protein